MNLTIISAAIVLLAVAGYAFGDFGDFDPANIFGGFGGQDGQFNNDNVYQPQTDNPSPFGNPGTGTMLDFGQGQGPNQAEGMLGLGPQGPPSTPVGQGSDDGSPVATPPPAPTRPADDGSQGSPSAGSSGSSNTPTPPGDNQVNPAAAARPVALPATPNQPNSPPPPPPATAAAATTTNGAMHDNPLSDLLNLAAGINSQDPQNSNSDSK